MNSIHESIVLVGGGGGVYRIARFLKNTRVNISTIQTMFDHGGHSGNLRDERGILPPGDIRQAILGLADESISLELRSLLAYRFESENHSSLNGATVGNIMIAALTDITGSMPGAIEALCKLFGVKGKVFPVSLTDAELCVRLSDGTKLSGEGAIDTRPIADPRTISEVFLEPDASMYAKAYEAIVSADKIVFCPGDLYTSILPNTLVFGFREAIAETKAQIIVVVNIMTKKSETHGYSASDFVQKIIDHIGNKKVDVVICNVGSIKPDILERYKLELSFPVSVNRENLERLANKVMFENLADQSSDIIRHHEKIASIIATL